MMNEADIININVHGFEMEDLDSNGDIDNLRKSNRGARDFGVCFSQTVREYDINTQESVASGSQLDRILHLKETNIKRYSQFQKSKKNSDSSTEKSNE